jgi:hypothetical protein
MTATTPADPADPADPAGLAPAAPVRKEQENSPKNRFPTLQLIDEQLVGSCGQSALLRARVAAKIHAGLRRGEVIRLGIDDSIPSTATALNGLLQIHAKFFWTASAGRRSPQGIERFRPVLICGNPWTAGRGRFRMAGGCFRGRNMAMGRGQFFG